MLFLFWQIYSLIYTRQAIKTFRGEHLLHHSGQVVAWDSLDINELTSALRYTTDPDTIAILRAKIKESTKETNP